MDSAYDTKSIEDFITDNGRIPIIDPNNEFFLPSGSRSVRPSSDPTHLKDWLIPPKIMVRGTEKVSHCLMTGVLCLAAIKILQYCIPSDIRKTA